MKKVTLIFPLLLFVLNAMAQTPNYDGVLTHRSSYFRMHPYSSSYDDNSHARIFYDGNRKEIKFWNSDPDTKNTNLSIGALRMDWTSQNENYFKETLLTYYGHAFILGTDPGNHRTVALNLVPGGEDGVTTPSSIALHTATAEGVSTQSVRLNSNGSTYFNGGKVGIGTTDPSAQLHVNGDILASEVRVSTEANNVPDYVFRSDYNLMNLNELEEYIKAHSHLPDVPSAAQMEAEGHNLAEMNLILLKKIEELTLYLIEEEKRNALQHKRFQELRLNTSKQVEVMEEKNLQQQNLINSILERLEKIENQ